MPIVMLGNTRLPFVPRSPIKPSKAHHGNDDDDRDHNIDAKDHPWSIVQHVKGGGEPIVVMQGWGPIPSDVLYDDVPTDEETENGHTRTPSFNLHAWLISMKSHGKVGNGRGIRSREGMIEIGLPEFEADRLVETIGKEAYPEPGSNVISWWNIAKEVVRRSNMVVPAHVTGFIGRGLQAQRYVEWVMEQPISEGSNVPIPGYEPLGDPPRTPDYEPSTPSPPPTTTDGLPPTSPSYAPCTPDHIRAESRPDSPTIFLNDEEEYTYNQRHGLHDSDDDDDDNDGDDVFKAIDAEIDRITSSPPARLPIFTGVKPKPIGGSFGGVSSVIHSLVSSFLDQFSFVALRHVNWLCNSNSQYLTSQPRIITLRHVVVSDLKDETSRPVPAVAYRGLVSMRPFKVIVETMLDPASVEHLMDNGFFSSMTQFSYLQHDRNLDWYLNFNRKLGVLSGVHTLCLTLDALTILPGLNHIIFPGVKTLVIHPQHVHAPHNIAAVNLSVACSKFKQLENVTVDSFCAVSSVQVREIIRTSYNLASFRLTNWSFNRGRFYDPFDDSHLDGRGRTSTSMTSLTLGLFDELSSAAAIVSDVSSTIQRISFPETKRVRDMHQGNDRKSDKLTDTSSEIVVALAKCSNLTHFSLPEAYLRRVHLNMLLPSWIKLRSLSVLVPSSAILDKLYHISETIVNLCIRVNILSDPDSPVPRWFSKHAAHDHTNRKFHLLPYLETFAYSCNPSTDMDALVATNERMASILCPHLPKQLTFSWECVCGPLLSNFFSVAELCV